jgi:hypothetical protein
MKTQIQFNKSLLLTALAAICLISATPAAADSSNRISFKMIPSSGAKTCLPKAIGYVTVKSLGSVENMHVEVSGLPANTNFDFFVTQVPDKPFGLSWYQGDIETDQYGRGSADFTGRFNLETFIVAPGSDVAPLVHKHSDASSNSATAPIHTAHLGLWFNSANDATKVGCPSAVTPFNGDHTAGIQVLNTSQYPKTQGPLLKLHP